MTFRWIPRACLAMTAVQAAAGCGARATREPVRPPVASGAYVLEQSTRDRWLHVAQRPAFTPFAHASSTFYLDVPVADPRTGERTLRVGMRTIGPGDSATLTIRADGRVVRQEARLRPFDSRAFLLPGDSVRLARVRLLVGRRLVLPQARVWELVPHVRPRRFVAGERWTDTIALATEFEGYRQALDGVRTSVLLEDTVVAGRRLWIVRDSARVRYTERELEQERTLDTLVAIDRTATGTMLGTYLFDRDLGLFLERDDTTAISGEAVLQYPDGRSFRTPARYERTRRWTLFEPTAHAARQAELRAERLRTSSGPVMVARTEIERRLSSGDSGFRDSLTSVWERERDPDRREELYRALLMWGPQSASARDALDARRVAAGDSAFMLQQLARRAYPAQSPPIDLDAARQMIRVMADPGIPFALGASRDALYENLVQTLVTWPPALAPDIMGRRCTPDACRLLGDQWRTAQEPRLRDVGLAALATLDPARWADTVIARAPASASVLDRVVQLVNGVGPAAAKLPFPAPDADWRAWMAWSSAPDPRYRPPPISSPAIRRLGGAMRFDESHVTAIQFYQLRAGRDVVGELTRSLTAATDDSARMVYGTILTGLGARPSVEQVAAQFRSGSAPQITLARRALPGVFESRGPLADSATAIAVLDRLLAASVDGVEPWPMLTPRSDSAARPAVPGAPARPAPYVLADSVPSVLRDRWRDRARFIGPNDWRSMSDREQATLLTLSSVERVGPFVRVRMQTSGRLARQANEVPRLYFGGTTYYLIATGDGWAIVSMEVWMT